MQKLLPHQILATLFLFFWITIWEHLGLKRWSIKDWFKDFILSVDVDK
jgi:hypothetical protein